VRTAGGIATGLPKDSVQIRFSSPNELRQEFENNIANRGIFIATESEFAVRQVIDVEIVLDYVTDGADSASGDLYEPGGVALSLRGEIVHRIPAEMAASGATPGVAVEFDDGASELRESFEPLLALVSASDSESVSTSDRKAIPSPSADLAVAEPEGRDRRGAEREAVRVPVRIMPTMSPPFEATSRDLSSTGILLTVRTVVLPIGEVVRTCLWHPSGELSVEIDGEVVREIKNKSGRIAAVAIAFDRSQAADPRTKEVIDALRQAGHRSRLGGISGSIVDLGLANMLQMFGSTAPRGTLIVERDGEQGWIAFADKRMLGAELGALSGHDALVAMLDWGDGRFQFEATADERLVPSGESRLIEAAVFDAVFELDQRAQTRSEDHSDKDSENIGAAAAHTIGESTTFLIDLHQEAISRSSIGKTEEAVLELAKTGISTSKIKSIIPESAEAVQEALESLVETGILFPR
jgi:hypothetical protein